MFPGSKMFWIRVAEYFALEPDKVRYMANLEIAPHFKELLIEKVKETNWCSHVTQSCQMDVLKQF